MSKEMSNEAEKASGFSETNLNQECAQDSCVTMENEKNMADPADMDRPSTQTSAG